MHFDNLFVFKKFAYEYSKGGGGTKLVVDSTLKGLCFEVRRVDGVRWASVSIEGVRN